MEHRILGLTWLRLTCAGAIAVLLVLLISCGDGAETSRGTTPPLANVPPAASTPVETIPAAAAPPETPLPPATPAAPAPTSHVPPTVAPPQIPAVPPELTIVSEVLGYWPDGSASVEVTAAVSNWDALEIEGPLLAGVRCSRDGQRFDDCGALVEFRLPAITLQPTVCSPCECRPGNCAAEMGFRAGGAPAIRT